MKHIFQRKSHATLAYPILFMVFVQPNRMGRHHNKVTRRQPAIIGRHFFRRVNGEKEVTGGIGAARLTGANNAERCHYGNLNH